MISQFTKPCFWFSSLPSKYVSLPPSTQNKVIKNWTLYWMKKCLHWIHLCIYRKSWE
jgi:hypothetical protein